VLNELISLQTFISAIYSTLAGVAVGRVVRLVTHYCKRDNWNVIPLQTVWLMYAARLAAWNIAGSATVLKTDLTAPTSTQFNVTA